MNGAVLVPTFGMELECHQRSLMSVQVPIAHSRT